MNNKFILSLVVSIIAAGGLGFYGGMVYAKPNPANANTRPGAQAGGFRGGPGGNGAANGRFAAGGAGGFSNGEVISKDDASITLKLVDGGSKIILTSSSTRIGKMTEGSMSDLSTGTNVTVTGTPNSDGSITASQIQIRPAGSEPMGMRRMEGQSGQPLAGQRMMQQ